MFLQRVESPLGLLSALWSERGLVRLCFGDIAPDVSDEKSNQPSSDVAGDSMSSGHGMVGLVRAGQLALAATLDEYFNRQGELEFALSHLDWTGVPEFHQKVLRRCAAIARGQTLTYGRLASEVGSPGAARAVGQAMARNRWPLIVPCHRVLGHAGKLTGYSGVGGTDTKRRLIDFEQGLFSSLDTDRAVQHATQRRQSLLTSNAGAS